MLPLLKESDRESLFKPPTWLADFWAKLLGMLEKEQSIDHFAEIADQLELCRLYSRDANEWLQL